MKNQNQANLFYPIQHTLAGKPPLVIKTITMPNTDAVMHGPYLNATKDEYYILLSALPEELQKRVETAIQALQAGM